MRAPSADQIFGLIKNYAEGFVREAQSSPEYEFIRENICLKINHTLRVREAAEKIARIESFTSDEQYIASLCALFHDIGRFSQFARYRTFLDAKSVNHATLGAEIIETFDCNGSLDDGIRRIIIGSTLVHNMQNLPRDLAADVDKFARLTRDADKIDILEIFCDYHTLRVDTRNDALELSLPDSEGFNPEIAQRIYRHETIPHSIRKNYNDMKLVHLAWILDLNYRESFAEIIRRATIERLAAFMPKEKAMDDIVGYLKEFALKRAQ